MSRLAAISARIDARAGVNRANLNLGGRRSGAINSRAKAPAGQLGLDFSAPPPPKASPGQPCGRGHIAADLECHKGKGQQAAAPERRPNPTGWEPPSWAGDFRQTSDLAGPGLRVGRSRRGDLFYRFKDRDSAQEWLAKTMADQELEAGERRSSPRYKATLQSELREAAKMSDQQLLEVLQGFASSGKATRGGTRVSVTVGADTRAKAEQAPDPEPVLTNPTRPVSKPFGAAPKARKPEEKLITAMEVDTPAAQLKFAKQQRAAAWRAGDKEGEKAWAEEQAEIQRRRLAQAQVRQTQAQTSLFGVTEYDETMPLFGRRDAADRIGGLLQGVLAEQLPGAQVLDWEQHRHGVTSGRAVAEGLVYRFRCDGESVGYRPAWDGLNERQWEARSSGFLEVRDPAARVDYRRPKFQQLSTKRKCSSGYSCGRSCISLNKECRITPQSAISKQRLRQLKALAQEGNPAVEQQVQAVEVARLEKASQLREKRNVQRLQKLMERPEIAELVRTGKLPASLTEGAGKAAEDPQALAGKVRDVSPADIEVDAKRFQYKIKSNEKGEVGSLSGVKKWDPNLAGVISVWVDPKDNKTYVINGHNRLGLAKRLGAEEVTVRYLRAKDAKEARAIGAMQNIAEGAGTEMDAAKFFRDTGIKTQEDVEARGLPLRSGKANRGLALSKLPQEMFDEVVRGDLTPSRGAIIGGSGLEVSKQREIGKMLRSRKSISDGTLQEYVEALRVSEQSTQKVLDVFGQGEETVDDGLVRADLANSLKRKLKGERRLFAAVSKSKAAEELTAKAGNVINREESSQVASEADTVLRAFDLLKNQTGPVSTALNQAAARIRAGETKAQVQRELQEAVIEAMEEELRRAGLKPEKASNEAPTMSMFDGLDDRLDALLERLDARNCVKGTPCGNTCIPKDRECRAKGSAEGAGRLSALVKEATGPAAPAPAARPAAAAAPAPAPAAAAPARAAAAPEAGQEPRKGFRAMARAAGQAIAGAVAKLLGRGGDKAPERAAASPTGLTRLQQIERGQAENIIKSDPNPKKMLADVGLDLNSPHLRDLGSALQAQVANLEVQRAGDEILLADYKANPRKWSSKVEKVSSDESGIQRSVRVTLDKPVAWGNNGLQPELTVVATAELGRADAKVAAFLRDAGMLTVNGPLGDLEAYDVSFGIGTDFAQATAGYSRQKLPPQVGKRLALEASRQIDAILKDLPDGTLLQAGAWDGDDAGDKRRRLYERAGFTFVGESGMTGMAVVRGGKIVRLQAGSRTDSDELDLQGLIEGLIALGGPGKRKTGPPASTGEPEGRGDRLDSLVLRMAALQDRLDARRKPGDAPGQMGLDFNAPAPSAGQGQPCGQGHIAAGLTCHKGAGGAPAPAPQGQEGGQRRGSLSEAMKASIEAMKAADVRQMSLMASQLFETEWSLERRGKYRGMTKDQAKQRYISEFAAKLQEGQAQQEAARAAARANRPPADPNAPAPKLSQILRQSMEALKEGDRRMEDLTRDIIDLRVKTAGMEWEDDSPGGDLGGGAGRRRALPGRRDGLSLMERLDALAARLDARRKAGDAPGQMSLFGPGTGQPCGEGHISRTKECHKGGGGGRVAAQEKSIQEVKAVRERQQTKGMDPKEIPVTEKDIEGMEQAKEVMAGRLSPSKQLEEWQKQGLVPAAKEADAPAARPFASPSEISFSLARRAYMGTSYDPEKRAQRVQQDYADHLNGVHQTLQALVKTPEQQQVLDTELASYRAAYKARTEAWLQAHSGVVSSMIAGPSNFPVRRMEKANQREHKALQALVEFPPKALRAIRGKLEAAKTPGQRASDLAANLMAGFSRDIRVIRDIDAGKEPFTRSAFTNSIYGRLGRIAEKGDVETVETMLRWLEGESAAEKKPLFTRRHSIWELGEVARRAQRKQQAAPTGQAKAAGPDYRSGEIERDYDGNRVRIRFAGDARPSEAVRSQLKRSGWRWSPTNKAWQRMNTENSVASARDILAAAERELG